MREFLAQTLRSHKVERVSRTRRYLKINWPTIGLPTETNQPEQIAFQL